jgi:hypothetical protein
LPALGRAIFIRTRQHINGWNGLPKEVSARITAARRMPFTPRRRGSGSEPDLGVSARAMESQ